MDLLPALEGLTDRDRIIVEAKLRGCSLAQCAAAAGTTYNIVRDLMSEPHIRDALKKGREISAQATAFTRERLSEMYMEAYRAAGCAAEMVMAINGLAKLHGLNAPAQVQIDHSHRLSTVTKEQQIKQLSVEDLERLANLKGGDVIEGDFVALPRLAHAEA